MPNDQFWRLDAEGQLTLLQAVGYVNEDELQRLVADFPELLSTAVDSLEDSAWLLIGREVSITFEDGDDKTRWSLDHLYVDGSGVPILVEVKRASDPRARREVVAQLLDYAGSFRIDWTIERLAERWERTERDRQRDPASSMVSFLETTGFDSADDLWTAVGTNIAANRLRLLFVADRLPPRLVRIIEYLNEQMGQTEVLGVEIRPRQPDHANSIERMFSVSIRGATAAASSKERQPSERQSLDDFVRVLTEYHGPEEAHQVRSFLEATAEQLGGFLTVGTAVKNPAVYVNVRTRAGDTYWPLAIRPRQGRVVLQLRWMAHRPGFQEEDDRRDLRDRMADATGASLTNGQLNGFPWFPAALVADEGRQAAVLEVLRWVHDRVEGAR
jgi:hypothetical protein